jgi:hypothetical protein
MEASFNSVKHLLTRMRAGHGCGEIAMSEWLRPPFLRAPSSSIQNQTGVSEGELRVR